ncbi:MAG: polysaccharide deacetylase family protein [Lachnospiraceae bacterium]|nr:polysaccharide deacetylase family protein [Lachnospiraceae bacterium]
MMIVALLSSITAVTGRSITVSNNSSGRDLPIYCVQTDKNQLSLSFDAAWGNEDTQAILDILKKHDINVTFFMTGGWVSEYPDDVKAILAAGHDLANHSENHKHMSRLNNEQIKEEIMIVHEKVKELTGYEMDLFRPPYGDYDNDVIKTAAKTGYLTIQWDVDSLDWKDYGVDSIIKTVCEHKNLGNGSIILMHNGAKFTHQALDAMIAKLKDAGYEFVPISELVYRENYSMNHEGRQIPKS